MSKATTKRKHWIGLSVSDRVNNDKAKAWWQEEVGAVIQIHKWEAEGGGVTPRME